MYIYIFLILQKNGHAINQQTNNAYRHTLLWTEQFVDLRVSSLPDFTVIVVLTRSHMTHSGFVTWEPSHTECVRGQLRAYQTSGQNTLILHSDRALNYNNAQLQTDGNGIIARWINSPVAPQHIRLFLRSKCQVEKQDFLGHYGKLPS
jgi:hypothetical protein